MNTSNPRLRHGFSLIEVLIAVVILSVGLLALAALQINIVRSTADAKARSTALSLAQEKLEQAREFLSRGSDQTGCPAQGAADWPGRYSCVAPSAAAETFAVGGTTYSRTWAVNRFVFNENTGVFETALVTTEDANLAAGQRAGTEFKRVEVSVGWTDAEGDQRAVTVTDSVSASSPSESSRARAFQRAGVRTPQVLIDNPNNTAGVIPIAIGNGSDTAATNPRPEVVSQGNNSDIIETRFDVLTYSNQSSALALVQKRVETSIVGCTCDTASASGSYIYRPTVWDGTRYSSPEKLSRTPSAGAASGNGNNAVSQSSLCRACCRDHHDPVGVAGPKVDPFRSTHSHYASSDLTSVVTSGRYQEACRMIRVDGIFRVASDLNSEHYGLVATDNSARSPVPDSTAASRYETFVLDYLGTRFVSGTSYNTIPGTADSMADTAGLNNPANISINGGQDDRWLHSRGVYIDYLSADAISKLAEVKANCTGSVASCVLPYVPFTTINMTELARWASSSSGVITVSNNTGTLFGDPTQPVRGKVQAGSTAVNGNTAMANSASGKSNTAIALAPAVDPDDAVDLSDSQQFTIGVAAATGDRFSATISGMTFAPGNFPVVSYSLALGTDAADCVNGPNAATPNPYNCTTNSTLGVAASVIVSKYVIIGQDLGDNPCTNRTENDQSRPYCEVRSVSAHTLNGSTVALSSRSEANTGKVNATTTISFPTIADGDVVGITFGAATRQNATGYTCSGAGNKTVTWTLPCE